MNALQATGQRLRDALPTMTEIREAGQNFRQDARALWLPVTSVAAVFVLLVGVGMWIERTNNRSESAIKLGVQMQAIEKLFAERMNETNGKLDRMQGSVDALMQMQATVAETKAQIGALSSRLDSMDIAIQTQHAWISTTRERLKEQGFETDPFNPPPTGGRN